MGINKALFNFELDTMQILGLKYPNLNILELGNQHFDFSVKVGTKIAKQYYRQLGARHTSIDLNGKDGALKLNLDEPLSRGMFSQFDLVTNYGTLEHVNNQYQSFKNMHDCTRIGGVMIHALPEVNNWKNHCRYHYKPNFVCEVSKMNEYKIILHKVQNNTKQKRDLRFVSFVKTKDDFQFTLLPIEDSGRLQHIGNYETKFSAFRGYLYEKLIR